MKKNVTNGTAFGPNVEAIMFAETTPAMKIVTAIVVRLLVLTGRSILPVSNEDIGVARTVVIAVARPDELCAVG